MGGIVSKWATLSPQLAQTTTIHMLNSETVGQEMIVISPQLVNGVNFVIDGLLTTVGTTFTSPNVVSKARSTPGQLLQLKGATLTGAATAGMVVQNQTKGSYAWIDSVTGSGAGTVWTMTQPFVGDVTAATGLFAVGADNEPTEDDTWAMTDTYQVYSVSVLNLVYLEPIGGSALDTSVTTPTCWVQNVYVPDVSGTIGYSTSVASGEGGPTVVFAQCRFDTVFVGRANFTSQGQSLSCWSNAGFEGHSWIFLGGASNTNGAYFLNASYLDDICGLEGDIIIHNGLVVKGAYSVCGYAYLDSEAVSEISGSQLRVEPYYYAACQIWGPGTLDVNGGGAFINESALTFATVLTLGGLTIDSASTGTSYTPGSPGAFIDGRTLNSASLDTYGGLQNPRTGSKFSFV
jgi:hypothetical protein